MQRITAVKRDTLIFIVNKLSMNTWPVEHKQQRDSENACAIGDSYLGIRADTAIRCRSYDLRCRCSQVAVAHNTRLGHPKAKDQVVSPQGCIVISTSRSAGLLWVHRITGERKNVLFVFKIIWVMWSQLLKTGHVLVKCEDTYLGSTRGMSICSRVKTYGQA